jgi:predicted PurR-regulated permease PerM
MILNGSLFTFVLLCAPVGFLAGIVIAFPIALPPVQRFTQRHLPRRKALVVTCGLLAFVLSYLVWTRIMAKPLNPTDPYWAGVDTVATNELWLRQIIPPVTSNPCYTGQPNACTTADNLPFGYGRPTWSNYMMDLVASISGAIGTGLTALLFTRPKKKP